MPASLDPEQWELWGRSLLLELFLVEDDAGFSVKKKGWPRHLTGGPVWLNYPTKAGMVNRANDLPKQGTVGSLVE
jgi:hypothetical protein